MVNELIRAIIGNAIYLTDTPESVGRGATEAMARQAEAEVLVRCLVVLLASLSFVGCALEDEPWHGDSSFTREERHEIEAANELVAEMLGVSPSEIAWDAPSRGEDEPGNRLDIVRRASDGGGHFSGSSGVIYLGVSGREGPLLRALAAHEFAHARGVKHHDYEGIMNPIPMVPTWTAADAKAALERGK